jgi:hypothetical protein
MNEIKTTRLRTEDLAATKRPAPESKPIEIEDTAAEPPPIQGDVLDPLFSNEAENDFRSRWTSVQTGFVDEPRQAVEQADELVAQVMQHLAQSFSEQRASLEQHWEKSEQVSTEDLRLALKRYRSFFDRLLSI